MTLDWRKYLWILLKLFRTYIDIFFGLVVTSGVDIAAPGVYA